MADEMDSGRFAEMVGELRVAIEDNERVEDLEVCAFFDDKAIFGFTYAGMPVSLAVNVTE